MAGPCLGLDPLWARAFNAVGGCYAPSYQATLMVRYATALLCLTMLGCYIPGYVIQTEPSGLVDIVVALSFGGP